MVVAQRALHDVGRARAQVAREPPRVAAVREEADVFRQLQPELQADEPARVGRGAGVVRRAADGPARRDEHLGAAAHEGRRQVEARLDGARALPVRDRPEEPHSMGSSTTTVFFAISAATSRAAARRASRPSSGVPRA